jgi:hypothetical protein
MLADMQARADAEAERARAEFEEKIETSARELGVEGALDSARKLGVKLSISSKGEIQASPANVLDLKTRRAVQMFSAELAQRLAQKATVEVLA